MSNRLTGFVFSLVTLLLSMVLLNCVTVNVHSPPEVVQKGTDSLVKELSHAPKSEGRKSAAQSEQLAVEWDRLKPLPGNVDWPSVQWREIVYGMRAVYAHAGGVFLKSVSIM